MKKTRIFILTVAILLCAVFLASCGADIPEDELLLIERGAPKFKIVTAAGLTEEEYAEVERFIATLGELGIELDEPITDEDETLVGDCEIIFGKDIKFREGCAVTQRDIGEEGYCVKTVGNKIVVCGGRFPCFFPRGSASPRTHRPTNICISPPPVSLTFLRPPTISLKSSP